MVERQLTLNSRVLTDVFTEMARLKPRMLQKALNQKVSPFDSSKAFHPYIDRQKRANIVPLCNLALCENSQELKLLTTELDYLIVKCLKRLYLKQGGISSHVTNEVHVDSLKQVLERSLANDDMIG